MFYVESTFYTISLAILYDVSMPRSKAKKYVLNHSNDRILEPIKPSYEHMKGKRWSDFFHNANPITLELACGKGEYSVWLAQHFADKNFVGIDIKGDRMRIWAQIADELKLDNVWFLRTIIHHLEKFFVTDEVSDIRIVHPDPRPRNSDAKRRLTHPRFLKMYKDILVPNGTIRLKTDDKELFNFSVEMFAQEWWKNISITYDLDNDPLLVQHYGIVTNYEKKWKQKGRSICYGVWENIK